MAGQNNHLLQSIRISLQFIVILWTIHFLQISTGWDFGRYGVFPREVFGLRGILLSPLIHSDIQHLFSNSAPLFFLSVMITYFYRRIALHSMLMIYLLTGLTVWLFGRRVFHIGASGVVYGLVSFVFWMGIFRRSIKSVILALIVTILYSSYILGILPNQEGISWESHLLGGLTGIFTAYWYKEQMEADEETPPPPPSWEKEPSEKQFFLERDVFEKTKWERERERKEKLQDGNIS
ncbi:MAG TPA: rhomboid family intramembrane serine protease [Bacteroidetes bacterium]|nr:rhomboid family intramembrane serine protease [Bacteroidota bacterium]